MLTDDVFCVSEDVISREVAGEQVLLNLETGTYYGLDQVGARVWQTLEQGPCSIAALFDAVLNEFDAGRETVEKDILALVADLAENGLVTHTPTT